MQPAYDRICGGDVENAIEHCRHHHRMGDAFGGGRGDPVFGGEGGQIDDTPATIGCGQDRRNPGNMIGGDANQRRFVFVETGLRSYERREVRTMPLAPPGSSTQRTATVIVQDGLRAGERVVVRGAFTLKSELAKASLSDEH